MAHHDSAAIYDQVRAHVEELQRQLGEGFGEHLIAGLATRAGRSAANKEAHHRSQFARAASRPPTLKQKQLLWALGYRGPTPANRAEVAALVDQLRGEADNRALRVLRRNYFGG